MEPEKKIARLAIGVEGGFNPDANKKRYEYEEHNSVIILPGFETIPLPNPELPEIVRAGSYNQSTMYFYAVYFHHHNFHEIQALLGKKGSHRH